MKPKSTLRSFLAMASSTLLTITYASAGTYYWDANGDATPGFGAASTNWDAAGTGNLWSTSPTGDGVGGAAVPDYATTTADDLFLGTPTLALTGTVTIVGAVNANSLYMKTGVAIAGTTPTINFSATGSVETTGSTQSFPFTTLTGAGTSMTWKPINNVNITAITSNSAGSTILQTSPENVTGAPGRVIMNSSNNMGVASTPLVFDNGAVRMISGFPYANLSSWDAAHPITFTLNKNAGLDNSAGASSTFTVDMAVNLGTGVFFTDSGVGGVSPIKLTSSTNTWNEVRISTGILEIDNLNQLGTTTLLAEAPLRFGSGGTSGTGGTLRIVGTGVTSFGTRPMLTTPTKLVAFDIVDAGITFTVNQLLDQTTGGLTKAGPGTLTINTTSSYTGTTTVSDGTLSYGTALGIANGAVTVNGAGAVLAYGAYNPSVGVVTLTAGTVTGSGTLTSNAAFVCNPTSPNVFPVGIKLGGTLGLNKTGTGTTTLSLDNSGLSGPVNVNGGVLNINSTNALGSGTVTLTSGTIDNTSGTAKALSTDNTITLAGNFAFTTLSGTASNNLNLGNGAVSITGNRTITLNGTGTTLTLGGVMTNNQANNTSLTANGPGNTLVIGGGIECSSTALTNRTITLTGTGNIVVSGAINNGSTATASALTKTGTGTLTLNGNNTYDGLTTHSTALSTLTLAGDNSGASGGLTLGNATAVLNINSNTALGTGTTTLTAGIFDNTSGSPKTTSGTTAVTLAGNTSWGGSNDLTLGGTVNQSGSRTITLTGAATLTFDNLVNSNAGNSALTVTGASKTLKANSLACSNSGTIRLFTVQGDGNLTVTGPVKGSSLGGSETILSTLTKNGAGILTLEGNNTYTGATTVTLGELHLKSGTQESAITVGTGGILGFTPGSPITSSKALTINTGHLIRINAAPVAPNSYTLITAASIGGTAAGSPALETPILNYVLVTDGNSLKLNYTGPVGTAFDTWGATGTLGPVTFDGDTNGDGVKDGLAFLLGVTNPDNNATGSLPLVSEDGLGGLVLTFNCLPTSARGTSVLKVSHSNDLATWTTTTNVVPDAPAVDGLVGFAVDTVIAAPLNKVTATIDAAAAAGGKLFGQLKAENP